MSMETYIKQGIGIALGMAIVAVFMGLLNERTGIGQRLYLGREWKTP